MSRKMSPTYQEMETENNNMKKILSMALILLVLLSLLLLFNWYQLKNLRQIEAGDYITKIQCNELNQEVNQEVIPFNIGQVDIYGTPRNISNS